ncbi:MAG: DNA-binding HxlR family transcriptional regulator [Oleiphilaceae bacterium]|jgi:DNA-binding HxlR family transcriptional regulator
MTENSKDLRSNCPINFAVETFGDKWALLVIRDLMFKGKQYYSDFLASDERVSTNILADRLQKLEVKGVISKSVDPEKASKYIYSLTKKGQALLPAMIEMTAWSAQFDSLTNTPTDFLNTYKKIKMN